MAVAQGASSALKDLISQQSVGDVFRGAEGTFVVIDCTTNEVFKFNPALAERSNVPCSTFKIWNTLVGLEEGIVKAADVPFYKWDGVKRSLPDWNRDLTLGEAFKASCVPAFQELARRIGPERMKTWIDKLDYGNRDISAGVDVFWLPMDGRKCIRITPSAQAELISRLVNGKLPVSEASVATLKDVMKVESTPRGLLYGKTGSGNPGAKPDLESSNGFVLGWFVGFLEHGGRNYAYACLVLGPDLSGKDAKRMVETVFRKSQML